MAMRSVSFAVIIIYVLYAWAPDHACRRSSALDALRSWGYGVRGSGLYYVVDVGLMLTLSALACDGRFVDSLIRKWDHCIGTPIRYHG